MKERAVRFGKSAALVGIVTEPPTGSDPDQPAVILLNSGILHRVGTCRLHIRIARALAPTGVTTMRFDYSGIGDSEARRDSLPFEESAVVETREAMDYLTQTRGLKNFVLMGLCSGADMAFEVAKVDARVAGLVQLDAWAYPTIGHYLHHYGPRMKKLSVWSNFFRRHFQRVRGTLAAPEMPTEDMELPTYVREFPPQEKVTAELQTLANRGVEFFYIYSGGLEEYNYKNQFRHMFRKVDFQQRLRVDFLSDANHIFSGLDHQQIVVGEIGKWMRKLSPAPVARSMESPPPAPTMHKAPRSRARAGAA